MKEQQDYIRDIAEIRSMMERSSRFLSLSGMAGIMAGVYALFGAYLAYKVVGFSPGEKGYSTTEAGNLSPDFGDVILLAMAVLILTVCTALLLSQRKARRRGEKLWNPTAKRLLVHMAVPLVAGGLLILILIARGVTGLVAPLTLVFYGLALFNASKFTYEEVRSLGLIEITLGLASAYFVEYSLLFWAFGFGVFHIIYGIYMHYRYER